VLVNNFTTTAAIINSAWSNIIKGSKAKSNNTNKCCLEATVIGLSDTVLGLAICVETNEDSPWIVQFLSCLQRIFVCFQALYSVSIVTVAAHQPGIASSYIILCIILARYLPSEEAELIPVERAGDD
jgi:hypothetical protein